MKDLIERFTGYVKINTQSDEESGTAPSSSGQQELAAELYSELSGMGIRDVYYDREHCYVYAMIPGDDVKIGFIAHMDTSPEVSGENINPVTVREKSGLEIIKSDGTTLLGADDKAGIAEIMYMAQYLSEHPEERHHTVSIAFTPDEEIGSGTDYFDLKKFGADFAYTVDGGGLGELEYESFNAAEAKIKIHGKNTHPGSAKDIMKNAIDIACEFQGMLPAGEKPQYTEGREGFFHVEMIRGNVEETEMIMIIRDHGRDKFEDRKKMVADNVQKLNQKYGSGTVEADINDQYYNMGEIMKDHMDVVERAVDAMQESGVKPEIKPIRGGTDGAVLSFRGLPTPNLCTGGYLYHSRDEYAVISEMRQCAEILISLARS